MNREASYAAGELSRARLLDAAAACFAEQGYEGTSVRDITGRAACNVSAIKYYFGGKKELYVAVFDQRFQEITARRVPALRALLDVDELGLEQVLETFAQVFLEPLTDQPRGQQTMKLFLRDMVESHLPEGMLLEMMIRPTLAALMDALAKACPGLDGREAQLCCHSLVSQLVHVMHMQRLHGKPAPDTPPNLALDDMIRHIVSFTAAGIRSRLEVPA